MHEGKLRGDRRLIRLGCTILDWMWERGWDEEYGGMFYFRDLRGLPVQEYWHDMKFWWPHNEAIIATLLAWTLTGDAQYARWHQHGPRLELPALRRSRIRRMVWLPAPRRQRFLARQRQHVEGPVPSAADAVVLRAAVRGDETEMRPTSPNEPIGVAFHFGSYDCPTSLC